MLFSSFLKKLQSHTETPKTRFKTFMLSSDFLIKNNVGKYIPFSKMDKINVHFSKPLFKTEEKKKKSLDLYIIKELKEQPSASLVPL